MRLLQATAVFLLALIAFPLLTARGVAPDLHPLLTHLFTDVFLVSGALGSFFVAFARRGAPELRAFLALVGLIACVVFFWGLPELPAISPILPWAIIVTGGCGAVAGTAFVFLVVAIHNIVNPSRDS